MIRSTSLILRVLFVIVGVSLWGSAWSVTAAEVKKTPPSEKEIAQWVRQLGSANFVVRENAAQELLACGEAATEALMASSRSPDREVRDRSRQILALVETQRRDATLTAFRSGRADEARLAKVPGWPEFSSRYGNDSVAREVYGEMLQAEWLLLAKSFSGDDVATSIRRWVAERYYQLQRSGATYRNYSRGTVLTFFLLAGKFPDEFGMHGELYGFARHPELQRMLMAAPDPAKLERTLIRKLVGDWILAASGKHLNHAFSLQTTLFYRMHEEGSIIAERVLTDKNALPMSKNMAMQAIVLRNDISQAPLIEPLLKDTTVLATTGRNQRERQLRDVALASLMKLNGHDVTKIGVKLVTNSTHTAFEFGSLGYASEEEREQAFETFRRLQADKERSEDG